MAIKTMSASTGGSKFSEGWHEVKINKATYGDWNGKKYLDLLFTDYPDNMNLRVYEVINKTTNEEFKLANTFKYANAGIVGVLKDPNGKNPLIQYDDEPTGLVDKSINIYIYKERKTGEGYSRIFDDIAPVAQVGDHLSFTPEQVGALKAGVEKRVKAMFDRQSSSTPSPTSGHDMPL
tara:strand:- start:673 stop:1206 length:534 start_codon:yes stop_codon:yes gene_type:complete